jgi:hypothetical protein
MASVGGEICVFYQRVRPNDLAARSSETPQGGHGGPPFEGLSALEAVSITLPSKPYRSSW